MKKFIALLSALIMMTGCTAENAVPEAAEQGNGLMEAINPENYIVTTITAREPPEHHVTAEEFEKEMGFGFNIPEGVEEVEYVIDTSTFEPVGFAGFYWDGVLWNAKATHSDRSDYRDDLFEPYKSDYDELTFKPEGGQPVKVHGTEPDVVKYYLRHYHSDTIKDTYEFNAYWYFEDEGLELIMQSLSEEPINKVPVEVFDPLFK